MATQSRSNNEVQTGVLRAIAIEPDFAQYLSELNTSIWQRVSIAQHEGGWSEWYTSRQFNITEAFAKEAKVYYIQQYEQFHKLTYPNQVKQGTALYKFIKRVTTFKNKTAALVHEGKLSTQEVALLLHHTPQFIKEVAVRTSPYFPPIKQSQRNSVKRQGITFKKDDVLLGCVDKDAATHVRKKLNHYLEHKFIDPPVVTSVWHDSVYMYVAYGNSEAAMQLYSVLKHKARKFLYNYHKRKSNFKKK